jgi:hypothetical protein
MPTPLMKSFAKQAGKKPKTVEKLWKKCEKLVKKEYDIDEDSDRFYPLVVGCLKNLLDIPKKEYVQKDEITTSNMGDYKVPQHMGIITRNGPAMFPKKNLKKIFQKFNEALETQGKDLDDVMSEMINFYSHRFESSEKIIESAINATAKYLKLEDSLVNDLK